MALAEEDDTGYGDPTPVAETLTGILDAAGDILAL